MSEDRGRTANLVAVALAVLASAVLLFVPVGTRETQVIGEAPVVEKIRLREMSGLGSVEIAVLLIVPILLVALPLVIPKRPRDLRLGIAVLATLLCVLSGLSIGIFYLPAALAMWVSARQTKTA